MFYGILELSRVQTTLCSMSYYLLQNFKSDVNDRRYVVQTNSDALPRSLKSFNDYSNTASLNAWRRCGYIRIIVEPDSPGNKTHLR